MSAKKLYDVIGEIDDDILMDTQQFVHQQNSSGRRANRPSAGSRYGRRSRLSRVATATLAAALAMVALLGGMVTAQATGSDVFGTMARWTEKIFRPGDLPFIDAFPEDGVIEFTNREASCIPDTLLSVKEDTQVDYVITVKSMDNPGMVCFSLYVDGQWNQEGGEIQGAGEVVLHGTPGRSAILISASCEMSVDITIARIPSGNTE